MPALFHSCACVFPHTPPLRPSTSHHFAVPVHMPKFQATDYGMRLARGSCSEESARTSLRSGMSPSTSAVPDKGRARRLAAKVCKGPRGCKGQERRPAQHKRSSARRPLCRSSCTGLASGKESDKLSGLGNPAHSNLNAKHDELTAAPGSKLVRALAVQRHAELPQRCGHCLGAACQLQWGATPV